MHGSIASRSADAIDALRDPPSRAQAHALESEALAQSRRFARADDRRAAWQLASTTLIVALGLFATSTSLAPHPLAGALVLGPLMVRVFVLQHDCGHGSLFSSRSWNEVAGTALSWLTSVPFDPWRTEHRWHHLNQGRLSQRGVDRVNSPMTVAEAHAAPEAARQRRRLISAPAVVVLGAWSLLGKRKRLQGFFHFRPGFPGRVGDRATQQRKLLATLGPHGLVHAGLIVGLGWTSWVTYVLAVALGGGIGALLFWVQHNFEHTMHAEDREWRFARVALEGSSYLRLGPICQWLTGAIGLHHVHHLNPKIPNYRLESARREIPALAAIRPLSLGDLHRCFTRVFWDEQRGRMVDQEQPRP